MTTLKLSIHLIAFKMCIFVCLSVFICLFDFRFYLKQTSSFISNSVFIKQATLIKDSDQIEATPETTYLPYRQILFTNRFFFKRCAIKHKMFHNVAITFISKNWIEYHWDDVLKMRLIPRHCSVYHRFNDTIRAKWWCKKRGDWVKRTPNTMA